MTSLLLFHASYISLAPYLFPILCCAPYDISRYFVSHRIGSNPNEQVTRKAKRDEERKRAKNEREKKRRKGRNRNRAKRSGYGKIKGKKRPRPK